MSLSASAAVLMESVHRKTRNRRGGNSSSGTEVRRPWAGPPSQQPRNAKNAIPMTRYFQNACEVRCRS